MKAAEIKFCGGLLGEAEDAMLPLIVQSVTTASV
jgi:hypothetical protein